METHKETSEHYEVKFYHKGIKDVRSNNFKCKHIKLILRIGRLYTCY